MNEDVQRRSNRVFPTVEQLAKMHRNNVRAVLLEDGVDPENIESEIDRYLNEPSLIQLPSTEQLEAMYARK